ncbi:Uncharacterised protein [Vibrio cholerae]|nr:Uncharacterised protein [Vibrio cholerae]
MDSLSSHHQDDGDRQSQEFRLDGDHPVLALNRCNPPTTLVRPLHWYVILVAQRLPHSEYVAFHG